MAECQQCGSECVVALSPVQTVLSIGRIFEFVPVMLNEAKTSRPRPISGG